MQNDENLWKRKRSGAAWNGLVFVHDRLLPKSSRPYSLARCVSLLSACLTTVDRRGGAKADRKKEIAIATSIENFFYAHISRAGASAQKFKMSPSHLVAFIDFVFPSFFKIIVDVFRNESLFSANNSVFHPSSRIPFCWQSSIFICF